jgi:pimeloyl-ACP methyl ester carboxylesterase
VVAAEDDPAAPPAHAERLVAGIADARLDIVAGAHLASVEQPQTVAALLTGFLQGASGDR